MKQVMWALAVAGMLLLSSALRGEAAGVASRGGGGGWSGGAPRGSAWVSGGSHGGGGVHTGSAQGSHWYRGGSAGWSGGGHHGGDWHGGTRVFIGGSVGWWGWPGWWGPGWWGYPYPYPYYAAPPVAVQSGPTTYIQQESAPPESTYWYYCKDAGAYYPYVKECPGGWMQVVPQSTPPGR